MVVFTSLLSGVVVGFAVAVAAMVKLTRCFSHFLCHHKSDAAAQARLLKMAIKEEHPSANVFFDSDNLLNLDDLFNTVRVDVSKLIVYLTRDTLRRPWCAGEVTVAHFASRAELIPVVTPGFAPPTDVELGQLDAYISQDSCDLAQYGVFQDDIKMAFQYLCGPEPKRIVVPVDCPTSITFKACNTCIDRAAGFTQTIEVHTCSAP
jgi:hypothetical protein